MSSYRRNGGQPVILHTTMRLARVLYRHYLRKDSRELPAPYLHDRTTTHPTILLWLPQIVIQAAGVRYLTQVPAQHTPPTAGSDWPSGLGHRPSIYRATQHSVKGGNKVKGSMWGFSCQLPRLRMHHVICAADTRVMVKCQQRVTANTSNRKGSSRQGLMPRMGGPGCDISLACRDGAEMSACQHCMEGLSLSRTQAHA